MIRARAWARARVLKRAKTMKTKALALIQTTRPKVLPLSIIPILLGTLLADASGVAINWTIFIFTLLSALCVQIGMHFINDAIDVKRGADTAARLGPIRGIHTGVLTPQEVYVKGMLIFAMALLFGIPLIVQGGWPIAVLMLVAVSLGYLYTGGPLPLAYTGLSDVFVLIFFGIVATSAAYYLQTDHISAASVLAGTQLGMLAILPLAINNLRDHVGDAKANKRTLVVRFGIDFGRCEVLVMGLFPFVLSYFWNELGYFWAAVLPWLVLPIATFIVRGVWNTEPGMKLTPYFGLTALLHLSFAVLLIIAFYV
jgi:1,4-dihydroxy-2-naphthoate octaprenyltransferase